MHYIHHCNSNRKNYTSNNFVFSDLLSLVFIMADSAATWERLQNEEANKQADTVYAALTSQPEAVDFLRQQLGSKEKVKSTL